MIIQGTDTQILFNVLEKAVLDSQCSMDFTTADKQMDLLNRIKAESEKNRHEFNAGNDPFYVRRNLDASLEFLNAFERFIEDSSTNYVEDLIQAYFSMNSAIERTPQVEFK